MPKPNSSVLPTPREDEEQIALFRWVTLQERAHPQLQYLYHIPNEGKRTRLTGEILKRMGMRPGVPDLCLPIARGGYHGLYIELKRASKQLSRLTAQQDWWLTQLRAQGYAAQVCYGWQDAAQAIIGYLHMEE